MPDACMFFSLLLHCHRIVLMAFGVSFFVLYPLLISQPFASICIRVRPGHAGITQDLLFHDDSCFNPRTLTSVTASFGARLLCFVFLWGFAGRSSGSGYKVSLKALDGSIRWFARTLLWPLNWKV
jgi:hypothetical protein